MTIELNDYGLMIDLGDLFYVSLSWAFLISFAIVLIAYKAYKVIKNRKDEDVIEAYQHRKDDSTWDVNEQTTYYTSAVIYCYPRPYYGTHSSA